MNGESNMAVENWILMNLAKRMQNKESNMMDKIPKLSLRNLGKKTKIKFNACKQIQKAVAAIYDNIGYWQLITAEHHEYLM